MGFRWGCTVELVEIYGGGEGGSTGDGWMRMGWEWRWEREGGGGGEGDRRSMRERSVG